jgi:polysaccharide export outer membrane protein
MDAINYINAHVGFRVVEGCIDIPDIGLVEVAGLTLEEARQEIQSQYIKQIRDIEVFVDYKNRLYHKVDLAGMVAVSSIPVDGRLRLFDALAIARVPTNASFFMSYVVRDGCPLAIDLFKLMVEGDMCQNIVLRGGDKIFIADTAAARATVMGEVLEPRPIPLPHGSISLREAIVTAGGINQIRGNRNCIQVIRGGIINPKVYLLSWEHIVHLPNESLLLIPGDTVYVGTKPITQWNDFMAQLLLVPGQMGQSFTIYRQFSPN